MLFLLVTLTSLMWRLYWLPSWILFKIRFLLKFVLMTLNLRIKFEVCYNQIFFFFWNYAMCNFFYKESNAHFFLEVASLMLFMTSYLATIAIFHDQIWTEFALGIKWAVAKKKTPWLKIRFWKYWAKPVRFYQFNWCQISSSKSSISFLFLICFDREEQIRNKKEIRIKKKK